MPPFWERSLLFTCSVVVLAILYLIVILPREQDDRKCIELIVTNNTIGHLMQLFFVFMSLNKICLYLPSFIKISDPPRLAD